MRKGKLRYRELFLYHELKSEYLLPSVIDEAIKADRISVEVLKSHDKWFGVTYKEDKEIVVNSIKDLVDKGVYPEKLFSEKI